MLIEAAEGIGENVVSGNITPNSYIVFKETGRILSKDEHNRDILNTQKINQLAQIGKRVEDLFGMPQDIEWAVKENKVYLLQTRPITT
jgi:pyruvate,water dikinase